MRCISCVILLAIICGQVISELGPVYVSASTSGAIALGFQHAVYVSQPTLAWLR